MAFGRRPLPPPAPAQGTAATPTDSGPAAAAPPIEIPSLDRHVALKEIMLSILAQARQVAEAVRTDGMITLSGIVEGVIDPTTAPIELKDLKEQFSFIENGAVVHPFYCFASPGNLGHVDPSAQFQIYELVLAARDLNIFCQEALRDEALGVALQVPRLPRLVDQIIVLSSFYGAYFDSLALTHQAMPKMIATSQPYPDMDRLKQALDRHKLMATDAMVVPDSYDELVPQRPWPFIGIELIRPDEGGDNLIHGIYFPADYARRLAASLNTSRLDALRARG